jgi:hypothetical protein
MVCSIQRQAQVGALPQRQQVALQCKELGSCKGNQAIAEKQTSPTMSKMPENLGGKILMALDGIIQEALHSQGWGTLTNQELRGIMMIVDDAKADLKKNGGNRHPDDYKKIVTVNIDGKTITKLDGES